MKLVVQIKLLPDAEQAKALLAYMRAFNAAATHAARVGFDARVFSQPSIHARCYHQLRDTYKISSQTAVRAIGKAVECFARDKTQRPVFRQQGAVTYDQRTFSFKGLDHVSLLTLGGRILVPSVVGEYFSDRLHTLKGQADLVYRNGQFFLNCTSDVSEPPTQTVSEFLGVDLGIANIATDSTGERHTGKEVEEHRKRHARARRSFQRKGTPSAKRILRKLSGKQRRYQHHVNHCLSKHIVTKALRLGMGIALENLCGIRTRTEKTVRKRQRSRLSNWSFAHLRHCLVYKARLAGVPLVTVNPSNTSRTCFVCGHCSKDNRKSQERFSCLSCGHTDHADHNAARNIGRLGQTVNLPQKESGF
jgi:IS605 OrfB family transposase